MRTYVKSDPSQYIYVRYKRKKAGRIVTTHEVQEKVSFKKFKDEFSNHGCQRKEQIKKYPMIMNKNLILRKVIFEKIMKLLKIFISINTP